MKTTTYSLPGIHTIGWVECDKLQANIALSGIVHSVVPVLTDIHPVAFFGQPTCECKTTKDGASTTCTATLKFASAEMLPTNARIGFVVTDNNGLSWLIGSKEPPMPTVNVTIDFGDSDGNGAANFYEVTHTAIKTLVSCQT